MNRLVQSLKADESWHLSFKPNSDCKFQIHSTILYTLSYKPLNNFFKIQNRRHVSDGTWNQFRQTLLENMNIPFNVVECPSLGIFSCNSVRRMDNLHWNCQIQLHYHMLASCELNIQQRIRTNQIFCSLLSALPREAWTFPQISLEFSCHCNMLICASVHFQPLDWSPNLQVPTVPTINTVHYLSEPQN